MTDWAEALRVGSRLREQHRQVYDLNEKRLFRIRQFRKATRLILYPEMKEAFDYVDTLYPNAGVKSATVYHTSKAVMYEVGYKGVGGFYDTHSRIIVISDNVAATEGDSSVKAEFTLDEVLCHELIHFAANYNRPVAHRAVEEEIAYGKSVNYLRSRGRTDDFIIKKNMMPYLVSAVDKHSVMHSVLYKAYPTQLPDLAAIEESTKELLIRQLSKEFENAILDEAYKMGQRMISLYGDNVHVADTKVEAKGRDLILDDD